MQLKMDWKNFLYKIHKGFYEISYNFKCWRNIIRNPYNEFTSFIFFGNLSSYQNPEYVITLSYDDYNSLLDRLNEPPTYNENLAKLLQRKAPWDSE